jgi:hypothetical protein
MPNDAPVPTNLSMRSPGPPPPGREVVPLGSRGKAVPLSDYNTLNPIYRTIANRLSERHRILLTRHVDRMLPDGKTLGEGISFIPADSRALRNALEDSGGFHWDDRRVPLYATAASHTIGEGFREYGIPSLHFQLADGFCNLHLDDYGFVFRTPNGDAFTPDMFVHILDELKWAELVAGIRARNAFLGGVFERMHPVLPSSQRNYRPVVGATFDLVKKYDATASQKTVVSLEFLQDVKVSPCNPFSCDPKSMVSLGERRFMLTVSGTF